MTPIRFLLVLAVTLLCVGAGGGAGAQATADLPPLTDTAPPGSAPDDDPRAATGGATTLEDILRRQRGETVPNDFRHTGTDAAPPGDPALSVLGGASDADLWRALRFGEADITATARYPGAGLLVQDSGMTWLQFRAGPLRTWGGYGLLAVIGLLALFYLVRGRIRIDAGRAGVEIERFGGIERFGHWLLAVSFLLLALTGLVTLYGRVGFIPEFGKEGYAAMATGAKWVHNNVAWAFMAGLVMVFVMWLLENIPNWTDVKWLLKGGGIFTKGHPHAWKFNAGQKIIFWGVIVLGASVSASGLSLVFPFELPMFAKTFAVMNDLGIPGLLGREPFPTELTPHAEMQLSQVWHAIVAFVMMAMILAHIYIGTVGMEGAFDAMGSGKVDLNWAKEHHDLWVEEMETRDGGPAPAPPGRDGATPAE